MKTVLVSKCSLDIEQNVKFKMSGLISPSKSLISSRWVTYSCSPAQLGDFGQITVQKHPNFVKCAYNYLMKIGLL